MQKKICRVFVLMLVISLVATKASLAQYGTQGPMLNLGLGMGYSSHAGDYMIEEQFRTKQYSGFRALLFDVKAGYRFNEDMAFYGNFRVAPANSVISPYRSYYSGLNFSRVLVGSLFANVGAGWNSAAVESGDNVGSGWLTSIGLGTAIGSRISAELYGVFGDLGNENYLGTNNPFNPKEFKISFLVSYAIIN